MRTDEAKFARSARERIRENDAVDVCDILKSRFCRGFCALVAILITFMVAAPATATSVAWWCLPTFDSSDSLKGLVSLTTGVIYQAGDDWAFECMKERCPAESFFCLLDQDCRSFVLALYVGVEGTGGGLCSRDLALDATCGSTCSRTTQAFRRCLEGPAGRQCTFTTDAEPVVVHRNALDEAALTQIEQIAREEMHTPGNHIHRSFGSDAVGNKTTGHIVTWLTPSIHSREGLVRRLRSLARVSATTAQWSVSEFDALTMRCAEMLEYDGGNSTGLGWHWDVGSTITMVTMLQPASDGSGELQLSTNCTVQRVPLRRGDMAVYRSRHRHRVTTTTSPRRVLAVEWWRGERTDTPHRPGWPGSLLQEPLTSWSSDSDGNVEAGGTSTVTNGAEEYEVEL